MLLFGRFISGFASGIAADVVPMYLGECVPARLRGIMGSVHEFTFALGVCGVQLLGLSNSDMWPTLVGAAAAPALVQLSLHFWLPETPHFYANGHDETSAEAMLVHFRGIPADDFELQEELFCMMRSPESEIRPPSRVSSSASATSLLGVLSSAGGSGGVPSRVDSVGLLSPLRPRSSSYSSDVITAMATQPPVRSAMIVSLAVALLQPASGFYNLFNFSTILLVNQGFDKSACAVVAIAMNIAHLLASSITCIAMDLLGRRALLITSITATALSITSMSIILGQEKTWDLTYLLAMTVMCFIIFFRLGISPVARLLTCELFPDYVRPSAMTFVQSWVWGFEFIGSVFFTLQLHNLGSSVFIPNLSLLFLGSCIAFGLVPETRGKSRETIERGLEIQ